MDWPDMRRLPVIGAVLAAVVLVLVVLALQDDPADPTAGSDLSSSATSAPSSTPSSVPASPTTSIADAASTTEAPATSTTVEPFQSIVILVDGPIPGTYDAMARCIASGESLAIVNDASTDTLSAITAYLAAEPLKSTGVYEGPVDLGMDARTPGFTTYVGTGTARIEAEVRDGLFTALTFEVEGPWMGARRSPSPAAVEIVQLAQTRTGPCRNTTSFDPVASTTVEDSPPVADPSR